MSTTLTNGLKLPDKGSVDWYADMQNNYTILDGAVGTVAEHTSALAGKAPLVHTHVKADITDFPVYGNAAGTICEGNDARLSDARTPVAHTHTKSDVTDLLNSNFIPSANNAYDLGSSSYQWNNLYAKNYYYNGVAWGLDKINTWSNEQRFSNSLCLKGDRNAYICPMWAGAASGMAFLATDASKYFVFGQRTTDNNRYVYDATKGYLVIRVGETDGNNYVDVIPTGTDTRLGDSTHQWKTFNGLNPGALSLPDYSHPIFLDVTAQGLNWHTDTTPNFYEIPANGYFAVIVQCQNISNGVLDIFVNNTGIGSSDHGTYAGNELFCYVPVIKGSLVRVRARCDNYYSVAFYPCLGNV